MKSIDWIKRALVLGSVFFIAALWVKPVGVSTQYSVLSGIIHSTIDRDVITEDDVREYGYQSTNDYYDRNEGKLANSIKNPWNYDFVFVLAIPLGAFAMHFIIKKCKKSEVDELELNEACPLKETDIRPNILHTYLPSFIGGFVLLYGARMADGCTSGHMMSGMMQGAVSGYIFAIAVFTIAIPTAILVGSCYKNRRR